MCPLVSPFLFGEKHQERFPSDIKGGEEVYFLNNFHMRYFTIGLLCVMSHCWEAGRY